MVYKVLIYLTSIMVLLVCMFTSCSKSNEYLVTYPQKYTTSYCNDNYIQADPNLMYIRIADNDIGKVDIPGGFAKYYAIKDVPVDEYLVLNKSVIFAPLSYEIVKNKNNNDLLGQEILLYPIKSVQIYLKTNSTVNDINKKELGADLVGKYVSSIDGEKAVAFQSQIIENLTKGNYRATGLAGDLLEVVEKEGNPICLRVIFENYENIVWESGLFKQNDAYYIVFYTPVDSHNGEWIQNWLPISQELVELIP